MTNKLIFEKSEEFIKAYYAMQEFARLNPDVFKTTRGKVIRPIGDDKKYIFYRSIHRIELWRAEDYEKKDEGKLPLRKAQTTTGPKILGRLLDAYLEDLS